ncbi:toxin-antitoxin system YwqK family antitoxin [Flavobacterium sp. WC2509]|uniref:toxin-antitoxin system YwqK family antitoxin n=1 Tax=Flavobacterium sp. WC2509 TaxID=3461406 RepID=UPI004044F291
MKKLLLFTLLFFNIAIQAQKFKTFNHAVEIGPNDNLKLYLSSFFKLEDNDCADYYMIAKFDKEKFCFLDSINVFYKNDKLFLKGRYKDAQRNGSFTWYHKNGKVAITGEYQMDKRVGIWQFYYPKGNVYKKVEYKNGQEYLIEFYDKKENQKVKDGNGFFKDELPLVQSTNLNKIEGAVVNGLPDGSWEIETMGHQSLVVAPNSPNQAFKKQLVPMKMCTESFSNGKFTKGISYSHVSTIADSFYSNNYLTSFTGNLFVEDLSLIRSVYCNPATMDITNSKFYNSIKLNFNNSELKNSAPNNWFLVTLEMDNNQKIKSIELYSTAPAEITNQLKKMIQNIEIPKGRIIVSNRKLYFPFGIKDHEIYFQKEN